jgi:hypothetical protein
MADPFTDRPLFFVRVDFELREEKFRYYDADMHYVTDPGKFCFYDE